MSYRRQYRKTGVKISLKNTAETVITPFIIFFYETISGSFKEKV